MADEYISKSKIAIEAQKLSTHPLNEWDTMGVLALIDRQPAADVAPVVHAHWEEDPVFDNFYRCSHCYAGLKSDCTVLVGEKYCGNCGARMDERREDGENV